MKPRKQIDTSKIYDDLKKRSREPFQITDVFGSKHKVSKAYHRIRGKLTDSKTSKSIEHIKRAIYESLKKLK